MQNLTLGYGIFEGGATSGMHPHDAEEAFFKFMVIVLL